MLILPSSNFTEKYRKIVKKQLKVSEKIDNKLKLLLQNPKHPSLRLHKLTGKKHQSWSISISTDLRILFTYIKEGILLIDIGTHNEVY